MGKELSSQPLKISWTAKGRNHGLLTITREKPFMQGMPRQGWGWIFLQEYLK